MENSGAFWKLLKVKGLWSEETEEKRSGMFEEGG